MTLVLPEQPAVSHAWRRRIERSCEATASRPPADLAGYVRQELGVDLTARYGGLTVRHPFGKASGQLSATPHQVRADVEAGVAFIVLKTVIAEDARGERSMGEWADPETKMTVGRIVSRTGRLGWTVTWEGRGWPGTLEEYLRFFVAALEAAREPDIPVVPSIKAHLPATHDEAFREEEYAYTVGRLLGVWERHGCGGPMLLEKDFSPTLAGDRRAADPELILAWLRAVPALIHRAAPERIRLGVKVMNALFDDAFQVEMLRALAHDATPRPAYLVVFNRLFDPQRRVAYGGWDLSDRNLRVLELASGPRAGAAFRRGGQPGHRGVAPVPRGPSLPSLSASGNICSGRMMVEYALRGAENGQVHTFFQVPLSEYTATGGSRTSRALHTLVLHPTEGLVVWLAHLHEAGLLERLDGVIRFLDVVDHLSAA